MGKSRRNRARPRKDPLAKAAKPPSDPELAALREKSVLPVIKDLQSSDVKARSAAAAAVSNLVTDTKCRKLFLREQIVHVVLTQTLTDASPESRAAGWDILRVLAEEEEADFCVHLFRQDVLSAVEYAASTALEALQPEKKLGKAESKVLWGMIESLVALVTALSEAQDEILEAIVGLQSTIKLVAAVIAHVDTPQHLRLDAVSCLMTLAEDNRRVAEFLVADEEPKPFSALLNLQAGSGPGRVLACGVLHNVFSALKWHEGSPGNKDLSDASLVRSLSVALDETKPQDGLPVTCQWAKPTEVLQLALEILASIGTSLQESMASSPTKENEKDEEWGGIEEQDAMEDDTTKPAKDDDNDEDMDDSKVDDEDMDEDDIADIQDDMDMVTGADGSMDDDADSADELSTLSALVNHAVPKMIRLANPAAQSEEATLARYYALSALNNLAWSISCFDFSRDENASILKIWENAGKAVWQKAIVPVLDSNTEDVELVSKITSLAWAVSRALTVSRLPLRGDEHNKFMVLYQASKTLDKQSANAGANDSPPEDVDPLQSLGVKCVGVLGQLALDPAPLPMNREIGIFITDLSSQPDAPAADVVEALNQLFDIYGDEDKACDKGVFWQDNFLSRLEALQPKVKTLFKTVDKRTQPELRARADEAVLNLGRFVQYKKKNKP